MFKVLKEIINEHISYKEQIISLARVDIRGFDTLEAEKQL